MVIATAGHIDHGKSALVEALTGVHPDRLPEEKRRGMTLDLGFGHWADEVGEIGVVDVPGHERFIRTMVAGAAGVDAVLLVVAANEGVQPQTVEHLHICRLLGVEPAVVAITKCDLADAEARAAVRRQVNHLVPGAACVEVSAVSGDGIAALRAALREASDRATPRNEQISFRLPIDRVFTLKGFGTVVTGTMIAGCLRMPGELVVEPAGLRLRVRGLQVHGRPATEARAGERTAVNLAGVEARTLTRGMVFVAPEQWTPTRWLDADLQLLAGVEIRDHSRVYFHLHTAECVATLRWLDGNRHARLRLAEPVVAAPGDRFILRQLSPARTLGGGIVTVVNPVARKINTKAASAPIPPPALDAGVRALVEERLRGLGLEAPRPEAMLDGLPSGSRAALAALTRENVVVECVPGWFLHRDVIGKMLGRLPAAFTVAEFKQATGLSRSHAIPLLEYLDRQRLTRRQGDRRERL